MMLEYLLVLLSAVGGRCQGMTVNDFIADRLQKVSGLKNTFDQDYWPTQIYPPLKWYQQKGLYSSYVHVNFHGEPGFTALRNGYKFPDDNGFVTIFVLQALVEAAELNPEVDVKDYEMLDSLDAILTHRDRNSPIGAPLYSFWNQRLNDKGNHYETFPVNIGIPLSEGLDGFSMLTGVLDTLHLSSLADKLSPVKSFIQQFFKDFRIPPDSDDTGCNLALGMKLSFLHRKFPRAYNRWASGNSDFDMLFQVVEKYHYDAFSSDNDKNTIDPRTFFWLRGFLQDAAKSQGANASVCLIPTWLLSQSEVAEGLLSRGISMPFEANNVDASVAANMLFGLSSALVYDSDNFAKYFSNDRKITKIMHDTASMLQWILENNVMDNRPDLALLYYPPVFDFYWFLARIVHLLNNPPSGKLPSVLEEIRVKLTSSMRVHGTEQILKRVQRDGDYVNWDDFLGNADTIAMISTPKHEDRIFSTCAALNALLDTWTLSKYDLVTQSKQLIWSPDVPDSIKTLIISGGKWLLEKSDKFPSENVFFSGSMKSPVYSLPFNYPHNFLKQVNGSTLDCSAEITFVGGSSLLVGVRGVIPESEYLAKLAGSCHGRTAAISYGGSNCESCIFPFWSAPSLTNALEVLVMSKLKSLNVFATE